MILLAISSILLIQVLGVLSDAHVDPWLASIMYGNVRKCSGSIISQDIVLTAASCITDGPLNELIVWVGISVTEEGGSEHYAVAAKQHENYQVSGDITMNDVALIKVYPPFEFGENISSVLLANEQIIVTPNSFVNITSWVIEQFSVDNIREHRMETTTLRIVSNRRCSKTLGSDPSNVASHICAVLNQRFICQDNSGGPIVRYGTQVGLIPRISRCDNSFAPKVYINIAAYYNWIEENWKIMNDMKTELSLYEIFIGPMFWPMTA